MKIVRAAFAVVLALSLLAAPLVADAQPPAKVPRVGYLDSEASLLVTQHLRETFRQGLRDLGYVEGQNIALEIRSAEGRLERLPALASELARLKVDIIVAAGGDASVRAAKQATSTIPIVMTLHPDPESSRRLLVLRCSGIPPTGPRCARWTRREPRPAFWVSCSDL